MAQARTIHRSRWVLTLCWVVLLPAALQAASFSEFVDPNPAAGNQFGATVVALSTGDVVITSPFDDAGGTDAGAVYLFNGSTGALIGTLRGSRASDQVGSGGVIALSNGNYVVRSPNWDNGAVTNAGAVTWGVRQRTTRCRTAAAPPAPGGPDGPQSPWSAGSGRA